MMSWTDNDKHADARMHARAREIYDNLQFMMDENMFSHAIMDEHWIVLGWLDEWMGPGHPWHYLLREELVDRKEKNNV